MEIVVEYVLIDNLVINFLILNLSAKLLKVRENFLSLRLLSSAALGAVCSLISPLLNLPSYLQIVFKLVLGLLMVRIGLNPTGFKKNMVSYFVFLLLTAAMGGVCFGIVFLLSGEIESGFVLIYNMEIPVGAIILVVWLVYLGIAKLFCAYEKRKLFGTFVFKAEIKNNGKTIEFDVFLDSGNTLTDPISLKPVMIVDYSLFRKIFDLPLEKILMKKIGKEDISGSHYIDFGTVGNGGKMLVFEVESVVLRAGEKETEIKSPAVGLTFSKLQKSFNCEGLIGVEFAKEFVQ